MVSLRQTQTAVWPLAVNTNLKRQDRGQSVADDILAPAEYLRHPDTNRSITF
jgi:hypothetical protein